MGSCQLPLILSLQDSFPAFLSSGDNHYLCLLNWLSSVHINRTGRRGPARRDSRLGSVERVKIGRSVRRECGGFRVEAARRSDIKVDVCVSS